MFYLANTDKLVADGILTDAQAAEIVERSRGAMVSLAINSILCFGILAATGGLIFWLGEPLPVATFGFLAFASGLLILKGVGGNYAMFGNATALIGAGLLIGGSSMELIGYHENISGPTLLGGGAGIILLAAPFLRTKAFIAGSILLMGVLAHLVGLAICIDVFDWPRALMPLVYLYTAAFLAGVGWWIDVRLITALAIVPFAQVLDTSTSYFHAAYVFYSPESTLSVLQMGLLVIAMVVLSVRLTERNARHTRILAVMGFIVANLCALVGSLWGDIVGETIWGPKRTDFPMDDYEAWYAAREAFQESALNISEGVFSVGWAIMLALCVVLAAVRNHRPLFNASLTFAAIHAYTQLFESFVDEPLAWVIGGVAAIPLAWGLWRADGWMVARKED